MGSRVSWKWTKLDSMATFWAKIRYRDIVSELDFFKNQITNYPSLVSGRKIELWRLKFWGNHPFRSLEDEYGTPYMRYLRVWRWIQYSICHHTWRTYPSFVCFQETRRGRAKFPWKNLPIQRICWHCYWIQQRESLENDLVGNKTQVSK